MKTSRQAIMRVSRELVEQVWPEGIGQTMLGDVLGERYEGLRKALRLPADCIITGVSLHLDMHRDLIAMRVQSPEFIETAEACTLPEVEAVYDDVGGKTHWLGWRGTAVGPKSDKAEPIKWREFL